MHITGKARIEFLVVSTIFVAMACLLSHHDAMAQDIGVSDDQADSQLIIFRLDPIANERALPDCYPDVPGKAGGKLSLAGCRDEYESASFAVYGRQDLQGLRQGLVRRRIAAKGS